MCFDNSERACDKGTNGVHTSVLSLYMLKQEDEPTSNGISAFICSQVKVRKRDGLEHKFCFFINQFIPQYF